MIKHILIFLCLVPVLSFAETSLTLLDESTDQAATATARVKFVIHVDERISLNIEKKSGQTEKVSVDSNVLGMIIDKTSNTIAIP